jgi:hypothetical protein
MLSGTTAPGLNFASTPKGVQSSDSPQTVTMTNVGNGPLLLAVPSTGNNPSLGAGFTLDGASSCPLLDSSASAPASLAAGDSWTLMVDFIPVAVGSASGALTLTDNNLGGSAATQSFTLNGTATKEAAVINLTGLNPTYTGSPINAGATTSPTGLNVTFTYNGSATAPTAAGNYTVVGTISDDTYQGTATGTMTIAQATAGITLTGLNPTYTGSPINAGATTSPTGLAVTYTYNGSATAPTAAGNYTVVGTIGDTNYKGTATGTMTIAQASDSVGLAVSGGTDSTYSGEPVSFTATVTAGGSATGSVAFMSGNTVLATVALSGSSAVWETSTLATGTDPVTAVYSGDANHVGSASSPIDEQVDAPVLSVAPSAPIVKVSAGQTAVTQVVVSSVGVPGGLVTLTATGLPANATASFSSPTVAPGQLPGTVQVQITTAGSASSAHLNLPTGAGSGAGAFLACGLLAWPFGRRRRRLGLFLCALLTVSLAGGLVGCVSSNKSNSATTVTPAGTYTVTITATASGATTGTGTFALTVQ